jgi:ribosomal protein S18 acetylase RimI-like enzyme
MTTFRTMEISDIEPYRERLVRFWQSFMVPRYSHARFDWLYRENPSGRTRTWLAFDDEGEIAGCGSVYPWTYFHHGEPVRVGILVDFAVDKRFRVFGPALKIQQSIAAACRDGGFDVLFVAPNDQAIGIFKRLGYTQIGRSEGWLRVLRSQFWIRKRIRSETLSRIAATVVDAAIDLLSLSRYSPAYAAFEGEIVGKCPEELDNLWQRERAAYAFSPDKSSAVLNWYYSLDWPYAGDEGRDRYSFYCLRGKKDRKLRGCIVFKRTFDYIEVREIFPPEGIRLRALVWHFTHAMRRQGETAIRLAFLGDDSFAMALKRQGFVRREEAYRDYMMLFTAESAEKYLPAIAERESVFLFFN